MEKLIHDAAEAKARGMSYGQYMATIRKEPVIVVEAQPVIKERFERECCICGTKFRTNRHNKKTCSHECSEELNRRNNREIYLRKKYGEAMGKSIGV
jgi:hypothetical protein